MYSCVQADLMRVEAETLLKMYFNQMSSMRILYSFRHTHLFAPFQLSVVEYTDVVERVTSSRRGPLDQKSAPHHIFCHSNVMNS